MMRTIHILGSFVWIGILIVFLVLLAVISGYLFWGMSEVIPGIMGQECIECGVVIYVLAPVPIGLFSFSDPGWFLLYYVGLVVAVVVSILLAVGLDGKKLVSDMVSSVRDGRLSLSTDTSWAMIAQLFCTYLFFSTAYLLFLSMFGVDTASPTTQSYPQWFLLFELLNASVYEEIATRLVFLGVPMFLIALGSGVRGRPLLKELLGGSGRMAPSTWALIAISASIFGLAHIPNWDVFKFAPTLLAGFMLGYVYVRKGIWASILFHFAVDYYWASVVVSSRVGHIGILAFLVVAMMVFIIVGFFFFTYYTTKAWKRLGSFLGIPRRAPATTTHPRRVQIAEPQRSQQSFGFTCNKCGFYQARYLDGRYQCLRCGNIQ